MILFIKYCRGRRPRRPGRDMPRFRPISGEFGRCYRTGRRGRRPLRFLIALAIAAQTSEGQLTALDAAAGRCFHFALQFSGHLDLMQIDDCIASGTDEMHMGVCIGIEPLHPANRGYAGDQALALEPGEIAVYRCQ